MKIVVLNGESPALTIEQCDDGEISANVDSDELSMKDVCELLMNGLFAMAETFGVPPNSTITLTVKADN